MFMRMVALAIMLAGGGILAPPANAAATPQMHNFYGIHKEVRDQDAFVRVLDSPSLKVHDRQKLVGLYNQHYGKRFGLARDWNDLLAKLGGSDFEVQPCRGTVFSFGVHDADVFDAFPRGCYSGELVLMHKATRVQVFSLLCGNMFQPPPVVYIPPPAHVQAGVVYTDKCGIWILYGCLDRQRVENHYNQVSPYFRREGGYSGIIPQHD